MCEGNVYIVGRDILPGLYAISPKKDGEMKISLIQNEGAGKECILSLKIGQTLIIEGGQIRRMPLPEEN